MMLRLKHGLEILLRIAKLPRATFYYHARRMEQADKYAATIDEFSRSAGAASSKPHNSPVGCCELRGTLSSASPTKVKKA